jgi:hypothetical protein
MLCWLLLLLLVLLLSLLLCLGRDQELRVWNSKQGNCLSTRALRKEVEPTGVARGSGVGVVEMSDRYLLYGQGTSIFMLDASSGKLIRVLTGPLWSPTPLAATKGSSWH